MSEQILTDLHPVLLTCHLEGDELRMAHEGRILSDDEVIVELAELAFTQVAAADFDHDGRRYRVNVFTIEGDGTLTAWPREGGAVHSPKLSLGEDDININLPAVIDAVDYDDVEPVSAAVRAARARAVYQTQILIRVRKKGSMPGL